MTADQDNLPKPEKLSSQQKAAATDMAARAIIAQEVNARDRKTETLRALRLQREAEESPKPAKRSPARRKAGAA